VRIRRDVLLVVACGAAVALCVASCGTREPAREEKAEAAPVTAARPPEVPLPEYTVLDEDVYDAPIKTQVILHILVSGEITKQNLRALLSKLYAELQKRRGFKYHTAATHIGVYAYPKEENWKSGSGGWIAYLLRMGEGEPTEYRINEGQFAQLGAKPEQKFGLSEAQRKKVFGEIAQAEDRAYEEVPGGGEPRERLENKYKDALAAKYGLTGEQLSDISVEGLVKDWPLPPP
jgi:hypothetical protein